MSKKNFLDQVMPDETLDKYVEVATKVNPTSLEYFSGENSSDYYKGFIQALVLVNRSLHNSPFLTSMDEIADLNLSACLMAKKKKSRIVTLGH